MSTRSVLLTALSPASGTNLSPDDRARLAGCVGRIGTVVDVRLNDLLVTFTDLGDLVVQVCFADTKLLYRAVVQWKLRDPILLEFPSNEERDDWAVRWRDAGFEVYMPAMAPLFWCPL